MPIPLAGEVDNDERVLARPFEEPPSSRASREMGDATGAGGELARKVTSTSALDAVLRKGNNLKLGLEPSSSEEGPVDESAVAAAAAADDEDAEVDAEAARGVTGFEDDPSSGPGGGEKSALTSLSVLLLMLSRCIEGR